MSLDHTKPGYHITENMPQGVYGEFSKITEEVAELLDADLQQCSIMTIMEISDVVGALYAHYGEDHMNDCYCDSIRPEDCDLDHSDLVNDLSKIHKALELEPTNVNLLIDFIHVLVVWLHKFNLTFSDAKSMADITSRAFINGHR